MDRLLALFLSLASFPCSQGHTSLYDQYDLTKCTNSYYSEKWTSTGEVPTKLAQAPPAPLYMRYNRKTVFPADIVTTENMIQRPKLKFASEPGALYTVMIIDFGIERFMGDQYFHWMVANVPNAYSLNRGLGDEVNEYLPPFYFKVSPGPPPGLDQTTGTAGHDLLVLLYKQMGGKVNMSDEFQAGCNPALIAGRVGDHVKIAEKYNLELAAGTFFYTTYTAASNDLLCYATKCTGNPLPFPLPGVNDGPACKQP